MPSNIHFQACELKVNWGKNKAACQLSWHHRYIQNPKREC